MHVQRSQFDLADLICVTFEYYLQDVLVRLEDSAGD